MTDRLDIIRPDDWHLHLRDGDMLSAVLPDTFRHFARAIIMPNLVPPVVTSKDAAAYRDRIMAALPGDATFSPLMTLYLTEETDPSDVRLAASKELITAVKLYPAGATTNSQSGVRFIERIYPVLEAMSEIGLPLLVHGEVTAGDVDIFDRERVFLDQVLTPIREKYPDLKIVLEHVTTKDGIDFVRNGGVNTAGTITVHHLIINRNAMFQGGIRPHYYCLPVAKREGHRAALVEAATSGDSSFFLGTDSAPHLTSDKESACGCAGIYTSPVALSCLAHVFEDAGVLGKLEAFASLNGPGFYGLPVNKDTISLERQDAPIDSPAQLGVGDNHITVFDPGFPLHWRVID